MAIGRQVIALLRQNGPMSYKSIHQSLAAASSDPASVPSLTFLKTKVMHQLRKNNAIRAVPPSTLAQFQQQQDGTAPVAAAKKHISAKQLQLQNNKGTWHFMAVDKDGSKAKAPVQRKRVILTDFPRYDEAIEEETAIKA